MTQTGTTIEFTREEIVAELEKAARRIGMSVTEMLLAFRQGRLSNATKPTTYSRTSYMSR
jgi:hypothetical protein